MALGRVASHAPHCFAAPALARYQPREILPGIEYQSEEELQRAAGLVGTTIFHPVGTCRDGHDRRSRARSSTADYELSGWMDCAWSTHRSCPPSHRAIQNSPTLMIAERASDMIREDRRARVAGRGDRAGRQGSLDDRGLTQSRIAARAIAARTVACITRRLSQ